MRAIKKLRQVLGVSQFKLAQASGVSVRELARIEAGEQLPRRETANGLDAGFDQIVTERLGSPRGQAEQPEPAKEPNGSET